MANINKHGGHLAGDVSASRAIAAASLPDHTKAGSSRTNGRRKITTLGFMYNGDFESVRVILRSVSEILSPSCSKYSGTNIVIC